MSDYQPSTHTVNWKQEDPLVSKKKSPALLIAALLGGVAVTVAFYAVLGFFLIQFAPLLNVEVEPPEEEVLLDVAMFEEPKVEEPEPEPIPEPEPEPEPEIEEPEPEPEPEPEVKEPEPEPEPKPEIKEPEPEPEPEPTPEVKEPEPEPNPDPPSSMKAVELEGLTMESTVSNSDFAIKQGKGIDSGKITNKYVDPKRFDKIKVGNGNGDGSGTASGSGTSQGKKITSAPKKVCKAVKAKPIKQVKVPKSKYPAEAKRRGVEGELTAILTVDKSGNVTAVKVIKSAGYGFDELAIDAFKKWKFKPAEKNCAPVGVKIRYNYRFTLDSY